MLHLSALECTTSVFLPEKRHYVDASHALVTLSQKVGAKCM